MRLFRSGITGYCLAVSGFLCALAPASAHELTLGAGFEHWLYREQGDNGQELNREQGWLPGVAVQTRWDILPAQQLLLEAYHLDGPLPYRGYTQAGIPHRTVTDETVRRYRGGWRWLQQSVSVGFFVQWQEWQRRIRAADAVRGLDERYRWHGPQLEIGWHNDWPYTAALRWGALVRASWWPEGSLDIDLRDSGYGEPRLILSDGYEAELVLHLQWSLTPAWGFNLQHHQGYRWSEASDTRWFSNGSRVVGLNEPANSTRWQSVWAGVVWHF
ncbi:hypothetical protein GJQ55_03315 [Venatoribacter cucullus]|uniref:Protochlamydia outer membrane protein domain-containing protein n=1 Tax=Venatoribacter cucullus TaxID=2661630 RepID=A0A9X7UWZ7_9GAMM|nr:hypothetical protein [Venatoribacter cucullus]QQD23571.1 hypothetical protein GJQ55_03315 [Venatoribacter cucullus]